MKLAAIEYRDIRLRPKLNKMCSEEKAVYCKDVKPGKARVVKCLMENMAQPNFGEECAEELKKREDVMKNDYRYDIGVFTSCKVSGGFWGAGEVGIDDIMQSHTVMIRCSVGSTLSLPSPPCTYPPTPSLLHLSPHALPPAQADVDAYCADAKNKLRGNATVLKCLVDNFRSVSEPCQTEMSRAVRIALWDYKPGAGLTLACDQDVTNQCPKVSD